MSLILLERPGVEISAQELFADVGNRIRSSPDVYKETEISQLSTFSTDMSRRIIHCDTRFIQLISDGRRRVVSFFTEKFKYSLVSLRQPVSVFPHKRRSALEAHNGAEEAHYEHNSTQRKRVKNVLINRGQQLCACNLQYYLGIASGRCPDGYKASTGGIISRQNCEPMDVASARCGSDRLGAETMCKKENATQSLTESKRCNQPTDQTKQTTIVADGGATWNDLTGFQRDLLESIAGLERIGETTYGLAIASDLEEQYACDINHGRLYPNLDTLVELGFLEKFELDKRTNLYELTDSGRAVLEARAHRLADAAGMRVVAADGGEP